MLKINNITEEQLMEDTALGGLIEENDAADNLSIEEAEVYYNLLISKFAK